MLATTVCVYFACSESGKDELVPAAPPTTEVANNSGKPEKNSNMLVSARADCSNCLTCTCCCGLTLVAPTNTNVDIDICGIHIGCNPDTLTCFFGGGCNTTFQQGYGGATTLNTNGNPTKIFCSGGVNDYFQVTNNHPTLPARFTIECGGAGSNQFVLNPGEKAIITKGTDCDIDPVDPCIF